jgi:Flp pilus assembly protein TadG
MAPLTRLRALKRCLDETGAELIEFALVLPLLLLMVAGIIDFGFMFQRYEVVTNAAREGARMASLPGYTADDVTERVESYLASGGLPDSSAVSVVWAPATLASGRTVNTATVGVDYFHQWSIIGPIASLVGGSGWTSINLRGQSVMRVEAGGTAP